MARRGGQGSDISGGPMNTIIAGFVGLIVIVAVVILGPVLAGSIEDAMPNLHEKCSYINAGATVFVGECGLTNVTAGKDYTTPVGSVWNPEYNTDIPTGESIWTTNVIIGGVVILIFFISLAIFYIRVIA